MAYCAQLTKDFGKFKEDFDLVGTHLGRAHGKFADAEKRLDRFESKLERAAEHEPPESDLALETPEAPRALDAA
jgi:DNA anti-recombination protein RmuC